jgi:hypothetical protein
MNNLLWASFFFLYWLFVGVMIYITHKTWYMMLFIILVFVFLIPTISLIFYLNYYSHQEPRWNWSAIEINPKIIAEKSFYFQFFKLKKFFLTKEKIFFLELQLQLIKQKEITIITGVEIFMLF